MCIMHACTIDTSTRERVRVCFDENPQSFFYPSPWSPRDAQLGLRPPAMLEATTTVLTDNVVKIWMEHHPLAPTFGVPVDEVWPYRVECTGSFPSSVMHLSKTSSWRWHSLRSWEKRCCHSCHESYIHGMLIQHVVCVCVCLTLSLMWTHSLLPSDRQ